LPCPYAYEVILNVFLVDFHGALPEGPDGHCQFSCLTEIGTISHKQRSKFPSATVRPSYATVLCPLLGCSALPQPMQHAARRRLFHRLRTKADTGSAAPCQWSYPQRRHIRRNSSNLKDNNKQTDDSSR